MSTTNACRLLLTHSFSLSLSLSYSLCLFPAISLLVSLTHYQNRCLSMLFFRISSTYHKILLRCIVTDTSIDYVMNVEKNETFSIWSYCLHFWTIANSIRLIFLMYLFFLYSLLQLALNDLFLLTSMLFVVN